MNDWDEPIVEDDWGEPAEPPPPRRRGLRRIGQAGPRRRGNTPRANASQARADAIREAAGRKPHQPDDWRVKLASGDPGGAQADLTSRKRTHNSGRGFGLAE